MRLQNGAPVYEIGTKVRVRMVDKPCYRSVKFVASIMERYRGLELTISAIYCDREYPYYEVRENAWWWDDSMLDIVEDFESEEDSELANASFGKYFDEFAIK